ncbi:fatty-acyl-CoA synthase [Marmoricola sp. OAE513]|uniref:AMP-binding protein n=1 Tax=Marmoricola sp. OAE513 TaxID=2817894 RepID=UPI001AE1343E
MKFSSLPRTLALEALSFREAVRAGLFRLDRPTVFYRGVRGMRTYGPMGGVLVFSGERYPDRAAVVDELGTLTYGELLARATALANTWLDDGFAAGSGIGILARNHRGFVEASFAAAMIGARLIYLNTDFGGPAIVDVCEREGIDILVVDQGYAPLVEGVRTRGGTYLAWIEDPSTLGTTPTLESAIASGSTALPPKPAAQAKVIILTSGTTGRPKGTERPNPRSLIPVGGLFVKVPYRSGGVLEACPPFFHSLGYAQLMLGITLGMTVVMRRYFDPAATLASIERNKVTMLAAVPVMLQRIVDLGPEARAGLDLSSLSVVLSGGSQLGADLAVRVTEAFGPVLRNLYASTEVAYVSIASPEELAIHPGTVGSAFLGSTVKILDDTGRELPVGETGRIFVANGVQFSGYTGGGGKEIVGGLMSSGDVGHFDENGLLFVDGRDDEMIISGGENLFPGEVEECLAAHPGVLEVAAIGVPDEEFGARISVFIVRGPQGSDLTEDDVRTYVRSTLARFKVPRDVTFLEELPRNPAGKVLKRVLVDLDA